MLLSCDLWITPSSKQPEILIIVRTDGDYYKGDWKPDLFCIFIRKVLIVLFQGFHLRVTSAAL